MKKNRKIFWLISLVLVFAVVFLVVKIFHAVKIEKYCILINDVEQEAIDEAILNEKGLSGYYETFGMETMFPSKDAGDYCEVMVILNAKNTCILTTGITGTYISGKTEPLDICYSIEAISESQIKPLTKDIIYVANLLVYRNGRSNEEIREYLSDNIQINIYTSNKFANQKIKSGNINFSVLEKNPFWE